jgi:hypothetical protein
MVSKNAVKVKVCCKVLMSGSGHVNKTILKATLWSTA